MSFAFRNFHYFQDIIQPSSAFLKGVISAVKAASISERCDLKESYVQLASLKKFLLCLESTIYGNEDFTDIISCFGLKTRSQNIFSPGLKFHYTHIFINAATHIKKRTYVRFLIDITICV